jgi:hypothetical protein
MRPAADLTVLMAAEQLTQLLLSMSEPSSQIQHVVVALNLSEPLMLQSWSLLPEQ